MPHDPYPLSPSVTILAASIGTVISDRLLAAAVALMVGLAGQIIATLLRPSIDAYAVRLRARISPPPPAPQSTPYRTAPADPPPPETPAP